MTAADDGTPAQSVLAREARLPRVPLPALEDSAARFLEWSAPLLTPEELAVTEAAVQELLAPGGPGRRLQAALEEYDARPDVASWLDDFWRQRYLGRRDRIALNANFFFLFEDASEGQVERAAALMAGALDYRAQLDQERLPPVLQRGRPLSMEQTRYVFSTTRIPGHGQDTVRWPGSDGAGAAAAARHVLVLHRGHAYSLDVVRADGRRCTLEELKAGLRAVLARTTSDAAPGTSVGHLTTQAREDWATTRHALLEAAPDNREALDVVESALFCVCLEDLVPENVHSACDLLLHGNSANRWFDKALSFIVFADGRAGLNAEHSKLDGTTILDVVDAVLRGDGSPPSAGHQQEIPAVRPVRFVLDAALQTAVEDAASSFADFAAGTATAVLSFPDVGTERIKALGTSPDAFVQLAYQLAHHRAKGLVGATYESIATRQYRHGRTEAMRVVTPEVLTFVAAMNDIGSSADARRDAFRAAATRHSDRARQCQAGQAPEQHLWELQLLQQRLGGGEPLALYDSPGWVTMREDYLSTSSAPSRHIQHFGFGSTSPRCIGVAYVLLPERFNVYLSTPRAVAAQLEVFARELRRALLELGALLRDAPAPA
ncbi:MAG TPA: choline/carnitine O-acyltransferase [Mycobacteriales bacterium]|jgi:carnitine O-acetyltransferase|nr:choline/carnitine O-acyltransferase [Mycobacteriales bacterium]